MALTDSAFNHQFGGTTETWVTDAFVKGYGYFYLELPSNVGTSNDSMTLASLALGFSLGSEIALEKATSEGLGGIKFNFPTKLTLPDSFQVTYLEISAQSNSFSTGIYVTNLHKKWIQYIRDVKLGIASTGQGQYTKTNYAGTAYVWFVNPDGYSIEEAYAFTGVFPTNAPVNEVGFNVTETDKFNPTITYSFDIMYPMYGNMSGYDVNKGQITTTLQDITNTINTFKGGINNNPSK